MRTIALLFICFTANFLTAQEDTLTPPRKSINLGLEETFTTRGINIQFLEVLEDSRCPEGLICVWAGQARVKLKISGPEVEEQEVELTLGITKRIDEIFTGEDFVIRGTLLTPYPTKDDRGKRDYELLIKDEKLWD